MDLSAAIQKSWIENIQSFKDEYIDCICNYVRSEIENRLAYLEEAMSYGYCIGDKLSSFTFKCEVEDVEAFLEGFKAMVEDYDVTKRTFVAYSLCDIEHGENENTFEWLMKTFVNEEIVGLVRDGKQAIRDANNHSIDVNCPYFKRFMLNHACTYMY